MKKIEHPEKIGVALTEEEFDDLLACVQEVASRIDNSSSKRWGGLFMKKQVLNLNRLANDLKSIKGKYHKKGVVDESEVEYEGLPEENCDNCD